MFSTTLSAMASFSLLVAPQDAAQEALRNQGGAYAFARPSPMIHFSPNGGLAYALGNGCIPSVMTGRPATEFFKTAAMKINPEAPGRHEVTTRVLLQEEDTGGCTVTATAGDPADLRATVLATLDDQGARRLVISDSGEGSSDSNGDFRQELHCLTLNNRSLYLVMSSSSARNRARLMATVGLDSDGDCSRRSAP
jgi:hypothetical protein